MILNETYTLENGLSIPKLGLGTWFIDDDQAAEAVRTAVKLGYRLIDTAQAYGNERGVGKGVRTCGVPREELFCRQQGGRGAQDLCRGQKVHRRNAREDGP